MSGGRKSVTVGYRYFMGLHFGLSYGPGDALLEIRAGDRTAWAGSQTVSGAISINAPNLFGGEEREGGIVGELDVMMGEPTQGANAYLAAVQGGVQPAYRGILSCVFKGGLVAAMNPYIKPWAFKIRRITAGWRTPVFYPARAQVTLGAIGAMNPAHIIYQCITDPEWGMGYPPASIDVSSFTTAADAFHAEGIGLCLQFTASDAIERFVQLVCDHAGAVLGVDRRTGLFTLTAIRGGYSVGSLPLFNEDNVVSLDSFSRRALSETVNEVRITYRDPVTGKDGSVTVQDLANVTSQGGVVSQAKDYPGIPTFALASRIAQRDLQAAAAMLAKVRLTVNRTAYALMPGGLIRFSWPKLGIVDMPLRIGRIDYGSLTSGTITIEALEDVFGLPTTSYVAQQPAGWIPPSTAPVAPIEATMIEAPYRQVARSTDAANFALYTNADCFVGGVCGRPPAIVSLGYDFETRVGAAAYEPRERAPFAARGTLATGISRTATSITLASLSDPEMLATGTIAFLGSEIVRVQSIAGLVIGIARGCLDTVPQAHAGGVVFWGLDDLTGDDTTLYGVGETVQGRFRTVATGSILAEGSSPTATVTTNRRFGRPYPPGDLTLNGSRYPATVTGALTVAWTHRDRVLQADTIVDTLAASIGPEAGTTYTLELYDETNTLRRTYTGLTGTSQVWTTEVADCGLGRLNNSFRVVLRSVRAGLNSWQSHDFTSAR